MRSPADAAVAGGSPQRGRRRRQEGRTWRAFVGELVLWGTIGLCVAFVLVFVGFLEGEPWTRTPDDPAAGEPTVIANGSSLPYTSFAIAGACAGVWFGVVAALAKLRPERNRTAPDDAARPQPKQTAEESSRRT